MTRRLPDEDESRFALWTFSHRQVSRGNRRVLIVHQERAVCASMCMLLRMKGLETAFAEDLERVSELMQSWAPAVLLLDTRLDTAPDYSFARQCRANAAGGHLLLIAMSNFVPMEPVEDLKLAGFDGHMRRPVETWRMIDVLTTFLEYSAMSLR